MMTDIFIVGAGGYGREVAWTIQRLNAQAPAWHLLGLADDAPDRQSGEVDGFPLLGSVRAAAERHPQAAVFVAVGDNAVREQIVARLGVRHFPALVDPAADVAPTARLGRGVFVGPRALVSVGAQVGDFALVNARAGVGHDVALGAYAQICPGATLSGATQVGARALVGSNAATVPGVVIGADAKIAAGLPVYQNVPAATTLSPFGVFKNRS